MWQTSREREHEAHQAKLEHMREQVESGDLVIRQMTDAEREQWAEQRRAFEAKSTPSELARQAAALENRRQRASRLGHPATG